MAWIKKIFKKEDIPPPPSPGEESEPEEGQAEEPFDAGSVADDEPEEEIASRRGRGRKGGNFIENTPSIEIERLKAQIETLKEAKRVDSERFTRLSEQIGELRSMIIEKDRNIQKLTVAATTATDMVKEVRPERLMSAVKKQEAHMEGMQASFEANEIKIEGIVEELKRIKDSISSFRGTKEILRIAQEVKDDIFAIQKTKGQVESHADKVEEIYLHVQKQFSEFQRYQEISKSIEDSQRSLLTEFEDIKIRTADVIPKKDFDSFKKTYEESLKQLDASISEQKAIFGNIHAEFDGVKHAVDALKEEAAKSHDILGKVEAGLADTNKAKADVKARLDDYRKKIDDILGIMEQLQDRHEQSALKLVEVESSLVDSGHLHPKKAVEAIRSELLAELQQRGGLAQAAAIEQLRKEMEERVSALTQHLNDSRHDSLALQGHAAAIGHGLALDDVKADILTEVWQRNSQELDRLRSEVAANMEFYRTKMNEAFSKIRQETEQKTQFGMLDVNNLKLEILSAMEQQKQNDFARIKNELSSYLEKDKQALAERQRLGADVARFGQALASLTASQNNLISLVEGLQSQLAEVEAQATRFVESSQEHGAKLLSGGSESGYIVVSEPGLPEEHYEKIRKFIRRSQSQNLDEHSIREKLNGVGWSEADIEYAFSTLDKAL